MNKKTATAITGVISVAVATIGSFIGVKTYKKHKEKNNENITSNKNLVDNEKVADFLNFLEEAQKIEGLEGVIDDIGEDCIGLAVVYNVIKNPLLKAKLNELTDAMLKKCSVFYKNANIENANIDKFSNEILDVALRSVKDSPTFKYSMQEIIKKCVENQIKNIEIPTNDYWNEETTKRLQTAISNSLDSLNLRGNWTLENIVVNLIKEKIMTEELLSEQEIEECKSILKNNIKKAVTEISSEPDVRNLLNKSITNELYLSLKDNKPFWEAVDIEKGIIRSENILFTEFVKFELEVSKDKTITNSAFFFQRKIGKPYIIHTIVEYIGGKVETQKITIYPRTVSRAEKIIQKKSFADVEWTRYKAGYQLLNKENLDSSLYCVYNCLNSEISEAVKDKKQDDNNNELPDDFTLSEEAPIQEDELDVSINRDTVTLYTDEEKISKGADSLE